MAPPKAATLIERIRRCGDCGRYYIPDAAYTRPSASDKERGLALHGEGVALSAIARTFGVTPPTVSRWIKKVGLRHCRDCAGGESGRARDGGAYPHWSRLRRRGERRTADSAGRRDCV